jgi:hypothetical protein
VEEQFTRYEFPMLSIKSTFNMNLIEKKPQETKKVR